MLTLAEMPPIPEMDRFGLPGQPAVFLLLYHVTFVLHVLFMNFALGTAVVCLVNDCRCLWSRSAGYLTDLNRRLFRTMPVALSFAVTFGVAPLLFVQVLYGQFFYSAMILVGLPWMGVVAVLIVVFYLLYLSRYDPGLSGPGWRVLRIAVSAAVAAGLAAVALMFTSNAVWSITPPQWLARYESGSMQPWPSEPHFWPRYAHNLIGGTAVGCLLAAAVARALRRRGSVDDDWAARAVSGFMTAALFLTAAQMLDGVAVVLTLRSAVRDEVMLLSLGNLHVWGWRLGVVAGIGATVCMAFGMRRPRQARWTWLALACIVATLGGMSMAREAVRAAYVEPFFRLADWQAKATWQTPALLMFLVSFLLALAVVAWMLWLCWRTRPAPPDPTDQHPFK